MSDALRDRTLQVLVDVPVDKALLQYACNTLAVMSPTTTRADLLRRGWALFDQIAVTLAVRPACGEGCHWCCTLPVNITDVEADMLARHVDPARRRRLLDNAARAEGLDDAAHTEALITCAFLDDGRCSVYDDRPSACRYWHSLTVRACEFGYGRAVTNIPLHAERVGLFKTVMMATAMVVAKRFNEPPRMGREKGELHAMVLRALRRQTNRGQPRRGAR